MTGPSSSCTGTTLIEQISLCPRTPTALGQNDAVNRSRIGIFAIAATRIVRLVRSEITVEYGDKSESPRPRRDSSKSPVPLCSLCLNTRIAWESAYLGIL